MAVGDAVIIFRATTFVPAVGVEICITSFHNTGLAANIGNSDNPAVNFCYMYCSNGATSNTGGHKLFITNTYPFYASNAAHGATGVQTK
jgi:hypothetical protein